MEKMRNLQIEFLTLGLAVCLFVSCSSEENPGVDVNGNVDVQGYVDVHGHIDNRHNGFSEESFNGWPKDAKGLIDQFNWYDKDELIEYNQPGTLPGVKISEATKEWVAKHEQRLSELGIKYRWSSKNKKYELIDN